jgi:hypothetical protein
MLAHRPFLPFVVAAVVALFCVVQSGSAAAQSSTPPLTVDQIRACMCQEQFLTQSRPQVEAGQAMRREQQGRLDLLEAEIGVLRGSMDPNNVAQQEQLKAKIYQSNQLRDQIRRQFGPDYMQLLREFNRVASSYNENCANHRMIRTDINAAASNLSCPAVLP